jgi:hypothetical protein
LIIVPSLLSSTALAGERVFQSSDKLILPQAFERSNPVSACQTPYERTHHAFGACGRIRPRTERHLVDEST